MKEIWKTIKNYSDYRISNFGKIKSLKYGKQKILKTYVNNGGYLSVILCKENKIKHFSIHRLVAITFISNFNSKPQVNHKDGNKLNNMVDNIEWVTKLENERHAWKTGLKNSKHMQGEKNTNSKLSENEVLAIHGLFLSGMTKLEISKLYEITRISVLYIVNGKTWKHVIF